MAGLGETCTHVAALLFAIEGIVKVRESKTVTQSKAYWLPPTVSSVEFKEIKDIDFSSAKTKKKMFDEAIASSFSGSLTSSGTVPVCSLSNLPESSQSTSSKPKGQKRKKNAKAKAVPEPTEEEQAAFLESLNNCGVNSAILSITEPYVDRFIPKALQSRFPPILSEFSDDSFYDKDFDDILLHCQSIDIFFTQEEADNAEQETREQAASETWF